MAHLTEYLHDGANWQAQSVLAYLRAHIYNAIDKTWNEERFKYDANTFVGRYENCREQGYIFSVVFKNEQRNYVVYEHRNSDSICVIVFNKKTFGDTPSKSDVLNQMKDKYDYTTSFEFGNIVECGEYIVDDIKKFISNLIC